MTGVLEGARLCSEPRMDYKKLRDLLEGNTTLYFEKRWLENCVKSSRGVEDFSSPKETLFVLLAMQKMLV